MRAEITPARSLGFWLLRHLRVAALGLALGPLALGAHAAPREPEPRPAAEELYPRLQRAALAAVEGQLAAARSALDALTAEEAEQPSVLFTRACIALEAGDLDSASRDIAKLRGSSPELPEARVLEALLTRRRERPSIDWLDAFLQAWNDAGRPNVRDSIFLIQNKGPPSQGPELESGWRLARSPEARSMIALAMEPEAERGRFLLQHLRELHPPEMIFAASWYLQRESLPDALRSEASKALRVRLAELATASPQAMQYRTLLLLLGSSPEAPLTPQELLEIESIAALSNWRETDFQTLYQAAHHQLDAAGLPQAVSYAFDVAVMALATEPAYLLKSRAEISSERLSPEQRRRLGEALWRIGSRVAAESTLSEHFLGLSLMRVGATALGDEARLQTATTQYDEARDAWYAFLEASPGSWPLHSLRESAVDASLRDEVANMRRFLQSSPPAP